MKMQGQPENKYVVTIARQFGSLGRQVAQRMSEKLGIQFYDRDIVDSVAKKLNLPLSVVNENEESANKLMNTTFAYMAHPLGKGASDIQNKIFESQQSIIKYVVERESCIVVGRCADYILSEEPNAVHIYIYAPYEDRVRNSVEELGIEINEAKRLIHSVDEARDSYHMNYAGFLPDDKRFKDILINSSLLGIEGTADYLAAVIRQKFQLEG